ncbi:MAG: NAD-dependent epimerase/dehydratase family protein [Rubrobacteraceae bacterium]
MRVLIAGCGYAGCALGERLAAEGHTVFGLRRNPTGLSPAIRPVAADLVSDSLDTLPPDLDFVFHTASPDGSTDSAYRAAYVEGLRNLLRVLAARREKIRRVILVSSTGVYAQRRGEWVDETSPAESGGRAGRRLLEGERLALDGPFPATVLRAGGIYGPGRAGAIERAMSAVPGDEPPSYSNRIHRDDLAGALRHLMLLPDPEPLYLGVDHEPADRRTVTEWLVSRTGERSLREAERPSGRTRTNKRCSNARLVASGYVFRYPTFREGFAAILDGMDVPLR